MPQDAPLDAGRPPIRSTRVAKGHTGVVIDPSLTLVWRRRAAAAVVDLILSLGVLVALVALQVERFTRDAGGFFSPDDLDRMATLQGTVNRYVEVGDTRYVLAGGELVMTLLVAALTTLAVYVLLPGTTGTSPGKRLFGLRVVTTRGDVVDLSHAATRAVVGVLDVLPVVVPWAVGAAVARRSPLGQRLGDKVAGTAVVDARRRLVVAAGADAVAEPEAVAEPVVEAAPTAGREPVVAEAEPAPPVTEPEPEREVVVEPEPTQDAEAALAEAASGAWLLHDPVRPTPGEAVRTPEDLGALRRPERERAAPPPQHRGVERRAPDPYASPSPLPADGDWPRPRAEPAPVWDPTAVGRPIVASAALPPAPAGTPPATDDPRRRADDPPPETDAVDPAEHLDAAEDLDAPEDLDAGSDTAATSDAAAVVPDDDRDLEPARTGPARTETATATDTATEVEAPAPSATAAAPSTVPAAGGPAPGDEPVWNEDWQAWLFYDRTSQRWHRHDPAAGTWDPIG